MFRSCRAVLELVDMWAADIPAKLASKAVRILSIVPTVGRIRKACQTSVAKAAERKRVIKHYRAPSPTQCSASCPCLHCLRLESATTRLEGNAQVLALVTDVPLTGLQHVKRVRRLPPEATGGAAAAPMLQILLCRATPATAIPAAPIPASADAVLSETHSAAQGAAESATEPPLRCF